jgi:hypothetical protein
LWSKIEPFEAAVHFLNLANICLKLGEGTNSKFCVLHQTQLDASAAQLAALPNGGECSDFPDTQTCGAAARGCRWKGTKCEDNWTGVSGQTKLDMICHPCTGAYARRIVILLKLMDHYNLPEDPTANITRAQYEAVLVTLLYMVSGVCNTDTSNQYCMPKLQQQSFQEGVAPCTALATLKQDVGCCAPSFIEFASNMCAIATHHNPSNNCSTGVTAINTLLGFCAAATPPVTLGETCAQLKYEPSIKLIISGVDDLWWADAANKVIVLAILKKIIAFNGGVPEDAVDAEVVPASRRRLLAEGIEISAAVTVGSATQFNTLSAGLSASANVETLSLSEEAKSAGLAAIIVTSQGVVNLQVTSGASAAGVFVAGVVAIMGVTMF